MNAMILLAIITSIMMVSVFTLPNAYSQNITQEQRKALVDYCFEHADRPNPIQDLVDKVFLPDGFKETCKSVKEAYDRVQIVIDSNLEIQRQKEQAFVQEVQKKLTDYNKCTLNSTMTYEDCLRIYKRNSTK